MSHLAKTKFIIATFVISWGIALIPAFAQTSSADQQAAANCSSFYSKFTYGSINTLSGVPQICTAGQAITMVISLLLQFSALIAVVFLMIGGFWYLTAAGNEEQSEKGRKAITSAVIGLIVIIMAFALVRITANLLTTGVSGTTAGSTSTTNTASTPSGSTAVTSPTGGSTTGNSTGIAQQYVSTDPSNAYYNVAQADVTNYVNGNQRDYVRATITTDFSAGVSVVSTVPTTDTQTTLVEMAAFCGSSVPYATVQVNGSQIGFQTFYIKSGNNWVLNFKTSQLVSSGDQISVSVCGHNIPPAFVVPQSARGG